ncbi:Pre-mRNA-splicing factor of RES complex-domain-containing protein [Thermothelomyces heterothallicus CBS 202.75]|uniref:Pre-mRNA-splicing factor of RES complex-domain-containing protein n=1 Tax=Thermothelomyces heterothallicus CBS 202.75 TaxID=1149848 RepID=UPI0037422A62
MPSDKAAYLAAHYLTVESKSSSSSTKKRKRKQPAASGLLITDDDETGWDASTHKKGDAEEDDTPITIAGTTAEFRRAKKSGWKTVGDAPALSSSKNGTTTSSSTAAAAKPTDAADAAAEADAIIASAAAEKAAAAAAEEAEDLQVPVMSNGTLAGLQSASALTAQLRKRQELEAAELAELKAAAESQKKNKNKDDAEPEVILRDATGRRVDASFRRAEARRQAAEAERAAKAKQDLLRGEVQAAEARARRERLEDAALLPLARRRDDAELNEELKRAERWNDPMAEFMASSAGGGGGGGGESGVARTGGRKRGRPVYKGPAPPNRYGIRPGYRWDGVDRSNGFEAERFKALNRREMQKGLEYTWQMDE